MDTVVSNPPPAMGQGEVHPFFHQGLPKIDQSNTSHIPSETTTNPLSLIPPQGQQTETQRGKQACSGNASGTSKVPESVPLGPEEDPNASRRKRRKTEKTKNVEHEASLRAGMSGWLGKDIAAPAGASGLNSIPESSELQAPIGPEEAQPSIDNELEKEPTLTPLANPADPPDPKRKVLKVNANGRLLSSPPKSPPGTAGQDRKPGKRGRRQKVESRLVSMKYKMGQERNVEQLIDDILNGRTVYSPPKSAPMPATKSAPPLRIASNKPTKPTHPFFAKKPPSKPPTEPVSAPVLLTGQADTKISTTSRRPFALSSPFGRPKNKFPELVHPLWPPRDLFSIQDLHTEQDISITFLNPSHLDRKKSKIAAIRVSDQENALLASTSLARKAAKTDLTYDRSYRPTLRIPIRHTASGRVLQKAVDAQMSWTLTQQPSATPTHPSISKLRAALPESLSAFDSGKYESQIWSHKYAPKVAEDVLQVGREAHLLRDWLRHLEITAVDTGKSSHENKKAKRKREMQQKNKKKAEKLDGFIVSSEEEASEMDNLSGSDDELAGDVTVFPQRTVVRSGDMGICSQSGSDKVPVTNAILLSGPSGCGKTASVYAVAKELDFEVFEINAGSRRSARDMLEKVGDMTQNHLVHLLNESDEPSSKCRDPGLVDESKQNKLMSFFKGQQPKTTDAPVTTEPSSQASENEHKRHREQKQSLILLEEADILFDEDKGFWTGVFTLISQSRRPIVMTCNDESLVPTQGMSLHAILRYQRPPPDLAADYLLLVAANEGHVLKRDAISTLYNGSGHDIRRSLVELNFWCQMGVGSEKAGLDWILPVWPPKDNVDQDGERLRVLSLNTYQPFMGWFNRDLFLTEGSLEKETEALRNTLHWWRLGIQEVEDASGFNNQDTPPADQFASKPKQEQVDLLTRQVDFMDSRSSLDILSSGCTLDKANDVLDTSVPPMLESHRSNYVDAHLLLQADLLPEYSSLSEEISLTSAAMHSRQFRAPADDTESAYTIRIASGWANSARSRQVYPSSKSGFQKVFGPIMRARHWTSTGRLAPSFEGDLSTITEDLAPYVRGIMAFDGRLKVYRDNLYAAWMQEQGHGDKRSRTTRASRAALEGSDKAFTRRERWFPDETNYFLVQATGMPEWQNALVQMGHFNVQPAAQTTGSDVEMVEPH